MSDCLFKKNDLLWDINRKPKPKPKLKQRERMPRVRVVQSDADFPDALAHVGSKLLVVDFSAAW